MSTKKLQIIGGALLQSDWDQSDPTHASFIQNKPELHSAALSGDYNQLENLPIIDSEVLEDSANAVAGGAVYAELEKKANVEDLPTSALSGQYADLEGKPGQANEDTLGLIKLYNDAGENEDGAMTQKAIMNAISNAQPKVQNITVAKGSWKDSGPYTQVLSGISNITANSKIDIQADAATINAIVDGGFSLTIKNHNGTITIYAVGDKPTVDLTLQLVITEVIKKAPSDVVWGSPFVAGTPKEEPVVVNIFAASGTAPSDKKLLWIDTANSNLLKYYNGTDWIPISAAWG